MAAATLGMRIVSATLVKNTGASSLTNAGVTTLTLVVEATASAASVPLATAGKAVSAQDPQQAKGLVASTGLTLTYDDTTGAFTSLALT
jgi:hypothetical protein